jgi:tRNA pseudouridine38-40 synthase
MRIVPQAAPDAAFRTLPAALRRRIAVLVEYDGAGYGGAQVQVNAPSVQAALERALEQLTGERVRVALAGRTDAGVHASGQVAAFDTGARHDAATFARALNALLPEDIAVRGAVEAPVGFDPRRHAISRTYRYTVWNAPHRSALWRRVAWHVRTPLAVEMMAREAAALLGEHDLASFGAALPEGRSAVRRVFRSAVWRCGPLVRFEIEATAFLPHQVRRTMGALVEIGSGRLPHGSFARWLAEPKTGAAGPTAPPHGLCLVRVRYNNLPAFPGAEEVAIAALSAPGRSAECGVARQGAEHEACGWTTHRAASCNPRARGVGHEDV